MSGEDRVGLTPALAPRRARRPDDVPAAEPTAAEHLAELGRAVQRIEARLKPLGPALGDDRVLQRLLDLEGRLDETGERLAEGFQEAASRDVAVSEATAGLLEELRAEMATVRARVEREPAAEAAEAVRATRAVAELVAGVADVLDGLRREVGGLAVQVSTVAEQVTALAAEVASARADAARAAEQLTAAAAGPAEALDGIRSDLGLLAERVGTLLGGPSLTDLYERLDELERQLGKTRRRS